MTSDPDHEHDEPDLPLADNPIWQQDNVTLHSVGIDIGSAGTQVVFSRLVLRRRGEDLTSRYVVVTRDTLFESELQLTPYTDDLQIDAVALGQMLDSAYAGAGRRPEDVDTGVVILTGEALRRRNAERIASVVAERAGDLVCATAGHHMEAMLAAYGSGAVMASHEAGERVLNIDIGGGTTKLALIDRGRVLATAALHVGGRLIAVEGDTVTRIEPGGRMHAAAVGLDLDLGSRVGSSDLDEIASAMADLVIAAVRGEPAAEPLFLTEPIAVQGVDGVIFSGGVAEYVYRTETRDFGDLGRRLGLALADRTDELPAPVLVAAQRIRATVLGASEYTVQLSGITSFIRPRRPRCRGAISKWPGLITCSARWWNARRWRRRSSTICRCSACTTPGQTLRWRCGGADRPATGGCVPSPKASFQDCGAGFPMGGRYT